MHLTVPSHWSRSIGTGGRDPSERLVTIVGMRRRAPTKKSLAASADARPCKVEFGQKPTSKCSARRRPEPCCRSRAQPVVGLAQKAAVIAATGGSLRVRTRGLARARRSCVPKYPSHDGYTREVRAALIGSAWRPLIPTVQELTLRSRPYRTGSRATLHPPCPWRHPG
jgi:hypothetical protein